MTDDIIRIVVQRNERKKKYVVETNLIGKTFYFFQ